MRPICLMRLTELQSPTSNNLWIYFESWFQPNWPPATQCLTCWRTSFPRIWSKPQSGRKDRAARWSLADWVARYVIVCLICILIESLSFGWLIDTDQQTYLQRDWKYNHNNNWLVHFRYVYKRHTKDGLFDEEPVNFKPSKNKTKEEAELNSTVAKFTLLKHFELEMWGKKATKKSAQIEPVKIISSRFVPPWKNVSERGLLLFVVVVVFVFVVDVVVVVIMHIFIYRLLTEGHRRQVVQRAKRRHEHSW